MENHRPPVTDFDGALFCVNRNQYPPEELAKYVGMEVAWSLDGKQILVSGKDFDEVEKLLRLAGIESCQVVHDQVESMDQTSLLL